VHIAILQGWQQAAAAARECRTCERGSQRLKQRHKGALAVVNYNTKAVVFLNDWRLWLVTANGIIPAAQAHFVAFLQCDLG
jgi:hypothetical protein